MGPEGGGDGAAAGLSWGSAPPGQRPTAAGSPLSASGGIGAARAWRLRWPRGPLSHEAAEPGRPRGPRGGGGTRRWTLPVVCAGVCGCSAVPHLSAWGAPPFCEGPATSPIPRGVPFGAPGRSAPAPLDRASGSRVPSQKLGVPVRVCDFSPALGRSVQISGSKRGSWRTSWT